MKYSFYMFFVAILSFYSCTETNNVTLLDSKDYDSKEERIAILTKEIITKSRFENADFELFNVNGFSNTRTTLPGASSWDYKFVIKVKPSNIDTWTEGLIKVDSINYKFDWSSKITEKRKNAWTTTSQPELYTRKGNNVMLIVYRAEGILFKRVLNL